MRMQVFVNGEQRWKLGVGDLLRGLLSSNGERRNKEKREAESKLHGLPLLVMLNEVEASLAVGLNSLMRDMTIGGRVRDVLHSIP